MRTAEGAGVLGGRRGRQQLHARRAVRDEHQHRRPSTTAETIETLVTEAKRIIAEPPTAEEIARAKQSILNSFIFNSATTEQVLGQQVTYEYYGLPTDWLERYRAGIEKVTAGRHGARGQAVHQARAVRHPRRRARPRAATSR